jgi:hypothetical protein
VDLQNFCFHLKQELGPQYGFAFLSGSTPIAKSQSLVSLAEQQGHLGDVVLYLVVHWLDEIHGRPGVLVEEEIHKELAIFQQELISRKDELGSAKVVVLFQRIVPTTADYAPTAVPTPLSANAQVKLFEILQARFNKEELHTLCFYLTINYEDLGGDTKEGKTRELILYLDRRQQLPQLIAAGKRLRPKIDWD